jgi:hypothetical protein
MASERIKTMYFCTLRRSSSIVHPSLHVVVVVFGVIVIVSGSRPAAGPQQFVDDG